MSRLSAIFLACATVIVASCGGGGGSSEGQGNFALIEFLERGKDEVPRNRTLTFLFSGPVLEGQNFFERLKIANTATGGSPDFSVAQGLYVVAGEEVTFVPRLPTRADRLDAGLRPNGNYVVFVKAGPDALASAGGDRIAAQQEFAFETSDVFEDPQPTEPPRATGLVVRDISAGPNGPTYDISRPDPVPASVAAMDNASLITGNRVIEPGGGAAFDTPWQFELSISEPVDPARVTVSNVELTEIYADATTSGDSAAPAAPDGYFGTEANIKVPLSVTVDQTIDGNGETNVRIVVTPFFTLVDNTRYRMRFSGSILGIDFRKAFVGDNGLTGDAEGERGGLGYVTEFIVRDRGAVSGSRTVSFDPLEDGILPEKGQTTTDPTLVNSALYSPASDPGRAVGFLPDFGDGSDGDLAVPSGLTILDTGDTPNATIGSPFTVQDINADDLYDKTDLSTKSKSYDSREYFDMKLSSLVIPNGATLQVTGVNPVLFRVSGLVAINGTLDLSGGKGEDANLSLRKGGPGGPGGGAGGNAKAGQACNPGTSSCQNFGAFLNSCTAIKAAGPFALPGEGPGRGQGGGDAWQYVYHEIDQGLTGTGGGGGSHATKGATGEDRANTTGASGTPGPQCANGTSAGYSAAWVRNSSVIGVRGVSGPVYGDREIADVTWGGSGGGAGGAQHIYTSWTGAASGGAGGGGGGSLAIYAAGSITASSGTIDVSGGDGGAGITINVYPSNTSWLAASGAGGAGSGGTIVMISGADITLAGSLLDARGGQGGARANPAPVQQNCGHCNAGGDGGKGYIFLMDADGEIGGLLPGLPGEYDGYANGVLTISEFETSRFSSIAAITELFHARAPNPEYTALAPSDVQGIVSAGQTISVFVSSTKADAENPLLPDLTQEIAAFEVAQISYGAGSTIVTVTGDMSGLNPDGGPARDSFLRVDARFEYTNGVEAALGPFASIDRFTISYVFNS